MVNSHFLCYMYILKIHSTSTDYTVYNNISLSLTHLFIRYLSDAARFFT